MGDLAGRVARRYKDALCHVRTHSIASAATDILAGDVRRLGPFDQIRVVAPVMVHRRSPTFCFAIVYSFGLGIDTNHTLV